jgi:His/Glu/Gln/Arg/opine family amino acid ABC transporter permease subunit
MTVSPPELLGLLLEGALVTVLVTLVGYLIGVVLGIGAAVLSLSRHRLLRIVGVSYVELFRGVPALVLVLVLYYGISGVVLLEPLTAAFIALGLVAGAYLAENFRAGIESVAPGQWEAARSIGLTRGQTFWRIIAPQGMGVAIPPSTSFAIGLLKESAVVSAIGVSDITFESLSAARTGAAPITVFLLAGALYLCLSIPIAIASRAAEHRLRTRVAL